MLIFALDDEPIQLEVLVEAIRSAEPSAQVRAFGYAAAALRAVKQEALYPDVVFSDIEMPGMTGIELARALKTLRPDTNVIMVTSFPKYAAEGYALRLSGYVLKPANAKRVREELDNLRVPVECEREHAIRVQCFGNFEVFANDRPLKFRYSKAKELLAYLVDRRGAAMNTAQCCAILWESAEDSGRLRSLFRNIVADMTRTLAQNGGKDIVRKGYNRLWVNEDAFDCDFYDYLKTNNADLRSPTGEYMAQYTWGEKQLEGQ